MQMITQVILWLMIVTGTVGQRILFTNPRVTTPCDTGARANVDSYTFSATAQGNITHLLDTHWSPNILLMALRPDSAVTDTLCMVEISNSSCSGSPADCITCNYTETAVTMAVSLLLRASHGGKALRMEWSQHLGRTVYSDKNYTLPNIADVDIATLALTTNASIRRSISTHCHFAISLYPSDFFELCCASIIRPCHPQITFRAVVVANNGTPCVTYSASSNSTGVMKLSYALCAKINYTESETCSVRRDNDIYLPDWDEIITTEATAGNDNVTTSAPISSSGSPGSADNKTIGILTWIALIIIPIMAIIVCILFYLIQRRRKEKARRKARSRARSLAEEAKPVEEAPRKASRKSVEPAVINTGDDSRRSSATSSRHSGGTEI